jgi:DNA-binding transcriptional ArsR family regulator
MVERSPEDARLTAILKAAADPSRRRILTLLVREGPLRVTELAAYFEISLNAVSKHIKVLEGAGLVGRMKEWRDHVIRVELGPLEEIDNWFKALRWVWEIRLETLDNLLTEKETDND